MKSISIIRTILKITLIVFAVYATGIIFGSSSQAHCSRIIILILFFKLFTTILKFFAAMFGSAIYLSLSAVKFSLLVYIIILIL